MENIMVNSDVTTLDLNGSEIEVEFGTGRAFYQITNKSNTDFYVSLSPNITPEAEGVYTVAAGGWEIIGHGSPFKRFYILGKGKAYIRGKSDAVSSSFKRGGKGGGENAGSNILPHSEGLAAYFDWQKNATDTSWTDIVGGMTIEADYILSDDFISPAQSSATMPIILDNPYTLYAIFKQNINNSDWSGILTNQTNNFGIFANQNKIAVYDPSTREGYTTDVSALNYHICAITFYNGLGSLYVDGVLKFTRTNINLANFPYYITYIGDYKMIGLCNNVAHGSKYILENTNYLAEKYGIEI